MLTPSLRVFLAITLYFYCSWSVLPATVLTIIQIAETFLNRDPLACCNFPIFKEKALVSPPLCRVVLGRVCHDSEFR